MAAARTTNGQGLVVARWVLLSIVALAAVLTVVAAIAGRGDLSNVNPVTQALAVVCDVSTMLPNIGPPRSAP